MSERWQQHPFRTGIIAGFVGLPLLWVVQESLLRLFGGNSRLSQAEIFVIFMMGALPGAVLGAGLFRAIDAHRRKNPRLVKWTLLCCGGLISLAVLLLFALVVSRDSHQITQATLLGREVPPFLAVFWVPLLTRNFPFHCAVLMFCIGLFMRVRH